MTMEQKGLGVWIWLLVVWTIPSTLAAEEPAENHAVSLGGSAGLGSPQGMLALTVAVSPVRHLEVELGGGATFELQPRLGLVPRFVVPSRHVVFAIGLGASMGPHDVFYPRILGDAYIFGPGRE